MTTRVVFAVRLHGGRWCAEDAIGAHEVDELRADLEPYGRLEIHGPSGTGVLEDNLDALILIICLQTPARLTSGEPVTMWATRYAGEWTFTPHDGQISIDGVPGSAVTAPADQLLPALHRCGERGVALLDRMDSTSPMGVERARAGQDLMRESRAALGDLL